MADGKQNEDESNYFGIPSTLCIEDYCRIFCEKFLEATFEPRELEEVYRCFPIILKKISLLSSQAARTETFPGQQSGDTTGNEKNSRLVNKDLESLLILTTFCARIWKRDLESYNDIESLKSISDYIEFFFDTLFNSSGASHGENNDFEANIERRRNYMIKYLNSQRILIKSGKSSNKREVINFFNELNMENMVLYPMEVKRLILNPSLEIPNFLDYSSFFLAMKQLVKDVLEKQNESVLSEVEKGLDCLRNDSMVLHELADDSEEKKSSQNLEHSTKGRELLEEKQNESVLSEVEKGLDCLSNDSMVLHELADDSRGKKSSQNLEHSTKGRELLEEKQNDSVLSEVEKGLDYLSNDSMVLHELADDSRGKKSSQNLEHSTKGRELLEEKQNESVLSEVEKGLDYLSNDSMVLHELADDSRGNKSSQNLEHSTKGRGHPEEVATGVENPEISSQKDQHKRAKAGVKEEGAKVIGEISISDANVPVKKSKKCFSRRKRYYTGDEEDWLKEGIEMYGVGKWRKILDNFPFHNRTPVNLKDKYRNMLKNDEL